MVASFTKNKISAAVVPISSTDSGKDVSLSTNQPNDYESLPQQPPQRLDDEDRNDEVQPLEVNTSYNPPFTSERAFTFVVFATEVSHYLQGYNLKQECLTSKYQCCSEFTPFHI